MLEHKFTSIHTLIDVFHGIAAVFAKSPNNSWWPGNSLVTSVKLIQLNSGLSKFLENGKQG